MFFSSMPAAATAWTATYSQINAQTDVNTQTDKTTITPSVLTEKQLDNLNSARSGWHDSVGE